MVHAVMKRLVDWFCWFLDCNVQVLAKRAGFNEKTLRLWSKGTNPLKREYLEILAGVAALPMALIDAVLLPSLATLRLAKTTDGEVLQDLAELAQGAETCMAGLGRSAVVELVGELVAQPFGECDTATGQWERLKCRSDAELGYLVEALPELRTRELVVLMASASAEAAADDAGRALAVARAAHRLGELAGGEGAERWALEAKTLAYLSNALRVANDPQEADAVFSQALARWVAAAEKGEVLLPRWRLLDLEGSLRKDQRRFPEALERLAEARLVAPPEAIARILVIRAATMAYMGDYEGSLVLLEEAAPFLPCAPEPRLPWVLNLNYGMTLVELGRYEQAERHWPSVQAAVVEPRKALDENLMVWLRARIDAGLGRLAEAREGFDRARREYEKRTMAANYAVVSLERAVLDLKEGRYAEVRELAEEMAWIFKSKGLHEEALAALSLFRTAAKREALTVDLAERMVRYLYRAQYDPKLKFGG